MCGSFKSAFWKKVNKNVEKKKKNQKLDNFGSFDVNEALMKAIERSFDDDFDKEENNQSK